MRIRRIILSILIIVTCTLFGSCKQSEAILKTSKSEQAEIWGMIDGFSIGKEGIVYQQGSLLHFADFTSGQNVVLCNKPNCKHIPYDDSTNPDPYCDAAFPKDAVIYSFIYQRVLYVFAVDAKTTVYERKVDESGWKKTMEIPYPLSCTKVEIVNGKVYMAANEVKVTKKTTSMEQSPFIMELNLKKHTYKKFNDAKFQLSESMLNIRADKNNLYYEYDYLNSSYKKLSTDELMKLNTSDFTKKVYQINLSSNKKKCIFNNRNYKGYKYIGMYHGYLYLYKGKKILGMKPENKKINVLWKTGGEIASATMYDNLIILTTGYTFDDIKYYVYYMDQNKKKEFRRPQKEALPILYANGILVVANFNDKLCYKAIRMNKYLEGSKDYLVEFQGGQTN